MDKFAVRTVLVLLLVLRNTNSDIQENVLNGAHLRIATAAFAPYVLIDHDEYGNVYEVHGFVNEIVLWLASKYNFTYTYCEPKDGFYGAFINNSWNGMVRMLIDDEADMIAFPLTPTFARTRVIDFSIPFAVDPMVALIPPPNENGKVDAIIKPYKLEVWISIVTSMLCIAVVTWLTSKVLKGYSHALGKDVAGPSLTNHILAAFGVISCQGQYAPQNASHSTRIAASAWCLACVVLVYLYSGCLVSFMTIPKLQPIVETLDELANSSQLQVLTLKSHFFESYLLEANSGTYKILGDALRRNPQNSLNNQYVNLDKLVGKTEQGRFAILLEKTFFLSVMEHNLKKTGKCDMSLMKEEFYQTREAFAISKKSSFLKLLDQGVNIMRDTGCIAYWHELYLNKINKCTVATSHSNRTKKPPRLKLSNLVGAFVLWICGVTISVGVFIVEKIAFRITC